MSVADADTWKESDRIIIGIDIGTTCSAVSYSYVYTGKRRRGMTIFHLLGISIHLFSHEGGPKQVIRVGKWPGLPDQRGLSKIPSVVYYDSYQIVCLDPTSMLRPCKHHNSAIAAYEAGR